MAGANAIPSQRVWHTDNADSANESYIGLEATVDGESSSPSRLAVTAPQQLESGTITLNAPNPAVSYGGIDPVIDENLRLVEPVSECGLRGNSLSRDKMVDAGWERHFTPVSRTTTSQGSSEILGLASCPAFVL